MDANGNGNMYFKGNVHSARISKHRRHQSEDVKISNSNPLMARSLKRDISIDIKRDKGISTISGTNIPLTYTNEERSISNNRSRRLNSDQNQFYHSEGSPVLRSKQNSPILAPLQPKDNSNKSGSNHEVKTEPPFVGWNPMIENNVVQIGEKSKGYKVMHTKQSRVIRRKYDFFMYAGIILGPLSGLLSGIGAIMAPADEDVTFALASACAGFISGIVVAITKYGKFEQKSYHHKLAASKYTSLESNVRRQLALCRTDRINASQYLEWIGESFDELFMESPLVSSKIYNEYVKLAKEHGIIIPDEYQITVNVFEDDHLRKNEELNDVTRIEINSPGKDTNKRYLETINNRRKSTSTDSDENKIEIHRKENVPEINKFSDGKMIYEIQRMMGRDSM